MNLAEKEHKKKYKKDDKPKSKVMPSWFNEKIESESSDSESDEEFKNFIEEFRK